MLIWLLVAETKKAESKPGTPVKSASKDKDNEKKEVKEKKPAKKREASPVLPAPVSEKKKTPVKKRALEEDEEKQEVRCQAVPLIQANPWTACEATEKETRRCQEKRH